MINSPTLLYINNQAAIYLLKDPKDHQQNKHIDIKYHFVREKHLDSTVAVKYVSTVEQFADSFTKALDCGKVSQHWEFLNILPK